MGRKIQFHDMGIVFDLVLKVAFRYVFLTFLWKSIFQYNQLGNWEFETYRIYIGASVLLSSLISYPNIYYMSLDIKSGGVINYLSKPIYYPLHLIFKNIGIGISNTTVLVPLFIIYIILTNTKLSGVNVLYFIFLSILGVLSYILFDILMGLFTFWLQNSWGLSILKITIFSFFSGSILPLDFFPSGIKKIMEISPFPGMIYRPIMVLIQGEERFFLQLFIQLFWCVALLILIILVFEKCKKNVVINGG